MANYEATKYDFDGANLTGIEGTATGTILPWSAASLPSGFLECAGADVSRTTYSALFAIVGTTYGAGDGSTTFNTPDLADNVPIGKSGTKALASTGGANTVTPTGNVGGSTANASLSIAQLASHNHTFSGGPQGGTYSGVPTAGPGNAGSFPVSSTGSGSAHSHNMSANFAGNANSVLQPYLTIIYIIKT
jgi:microcystin-dependent protein